MCWLLRSDVVKPHNLTSDLTVHIFGKCYSKLREFDTLDVGDLVKSSHWQTKLIFKQFTPSCDPKKGY